MGTLSTLCFVTLTAVHLGFGIAEYFQVSFELKRDHQSILFMVYVCAHINIIVISQNGLDHGTWMVNGKPGMGDTPIEMLLSKIFSLWNIAGILPMIMAQMSSSSTAIQWAILAPLFYHIFFTINAYLFGDNWNVINPHRTSSKKLAGIHAFLAFVCLVLYQTSQH